jgi:ABC-2 type transport system permease protein
VPVPAASGEAPGEAAGHATRAIVLRAARSTRVRDGAYALFFGVQAAIQPVGYRHSFPTLADRLAFERSFGGDPALRLFYGAPHDLLTVGGYTAWRVGGFVAILAGMWGAVAAVRGLRGEEDTGRQELVLAGVVGRRQAYAAALAAVAIGGAVLWLATAAGLIVGGLPAGGSLFLALATLTPAFVFAGVGALASQLGPTRRVALELAVGVLAVSLLLRVVADTSASLGWLRWATPLGWAEELRPFAGPRPAVLLLPVVCGVALIVLAGALTVRRDVGTGLLAARDRAEPRTELLGSPTAFALRQERWSLLAWLGGVGLFAVVVGTLAHTFTTAHLGRTLRRELSHVGGVSITTVSGALGFYFLFFVVAFSLFACSQLAAARHEEASERLATVLALPVGRQRWLAGRLAIAAGGIALLALAASVLAWAGARSQGASVELGEMLGAGANTLPCALLFLGLAALAFAAVPRAAVGAAYGLVAVAFVWELFGSVLGAPGWAVGLSPFDHIGLVPAQSFQATAAVVMVAIGAVAAAAALALLRRRDLAGA